jgi:RHS repeat-associated protein
MLDHDSESGTDHAQFRQYGNTQGRFMSPDPYDGSYDASNPQSFNRYAYALNSPLSYVDPSGLCSTQEYDEGGNPITCIEAWTWRTYMNSIDLDGSMTCSMSQVDCQSYFIMLLLQTSNASLPVSSRPSGGGGGGGGSAAPSNDQKHICGNQVVQKYGAMMTAEEDAVQTDAWNKAWVTWDDVGKGIVAGTLGKLALGSKLTPQGIALGLAAKPLYFGGKAVIQSLAIEHKYDGLVSAGLKACGYGFWDF